MKKVMTLGLFLMLLLSPSVYAVTTVVDAGNATCPVSGDKVSGKDFVEVNGKKYGLCCPMCASKLQKNPEKYLAEVSEGTKSADHHDHSM